jgi:hypothetical protein
MVMCAHPIPQADKVRKMHQAPHQACYSLLLKRFLGMVTFTIDCVFDYGFTIPRFRPSGTGYILLDDQNINCPER